MEKRTILAFLLSFMVLIIWSLLFAPKQDQTRKKETAFEKAAPNEISDAAKAPDLPHPVPSQELGKVASEVIPKVEEIEIEVDTPLYRAVFTNAGPAIKSFLLKKYHQSIRPDSPFIELVSLEKDMGDFFLMNFRAISSTQSEEVIYQVDRESVKLTPESSPKDLAFRSVSSNGLSIKQTFRFYPDQYAIDLDIEVANQSGESKQGAFAADLKVLPPQEKKRYYTYVGFVLLLDDELEEVKIKKAPEEKVFKGQIKWVAYEDDYFITAVIPEESSQGTFEGCKQSSGLLEGTYLTPTVSLNSFQQMSSRYTLYFGPQDLGIMKQVGKDLDRAVDFGWFDLIAKALLYVLIFFNKYINNYGVSIILLTILIKVLFWPLTHKSYKSMKEMQKLQPMMVKIREKYKNDKQKMNTEMMSLYKTYKVNPMSGCLPMIIQIPVFFALYRVLGRSIELRHAPFVLWINDLSAPDRLFNFAVKYVPLMEPPYGIPVLTLLMGASMFIQQKMTPSPGDPAQAKMMMFLPIVFTFLFINFPSGLVLYWLVNNLISIGQQFRILKKSA